MCQSDAARCLALQQLYWIGGDDALRVEITTPGMPAAGESSIGERVVTL